MPVMHLSKSVLIGGVCFDTIFRVQKEEKHNGIQVPKGVKDEKVRMPHLRLCA
jgi:hypothetical protein